MKIVPMDSAGIRTKAAMKTVVSGEAGDRHRLFAEAAGERGSSRGPQSVTNWLDMFNRLKPTEATLTLGIDNQAESVEE